jgi:NAD-dependent deacetylase
MPLDPTLLEEGSGFLRRAKRVAVFTGAGVSAESNIPTFRDEGGLWKDFPPEQFACWPGLLKCAARDLRKLADFLVAVLGPIAAARPNAAHAAIAALERHVTTTIITQNVDGLHQEAGSVRVREVHGSFLKVVGVRGYGVARLSRQELGRVVGRLRRIRFGPFKRTRLTLAIRPLLGLSMRGLRRPGVVLFGDALAEPDWTWAQADVRSCDVLLVVGTSGEVWPASLLPGIARQNGARVITVDPTEPGACHVWLRGSAAEILPMLVRRSFGLSWETEQA